MEEKNKIETRDDSRSLASEVIHDNFRQSKRWFVAFLVTLAALFATNTYWIYVINSYEYYSQDGEGVNTINTGHQEGVYIGTEDEN